MNNIEIINKNSKTLKTLLKSHGFSKRSISELMKNGIKVNNDTVYRSIEIFKGDRISIDVDDEQLDHKPIKGDLKILYEDNNILIISKSSGLTINSAHDINLANIVAYYFKLNNINSKIRFINRLDMNTSGIMMIAKNKYAQAYYQNETENNKIIKKYLAYVPGNVIIDKKISLILSYDEENKNYKVSDNGRKSITIFKTIERNEKYSIIDCDIKTGKTHQIRASLSYLGYPIIGDKLYGSEIDLNRFLLHSYYLSFTKFLSEESIFIKDVPNFQTLIQDLWKDYLEIKF